MRNVRSSIACVTLLCCVTCLWVSSAVGAECRYTETGISYPVIILDSGRGLKSLQSGDVVCLFDGPICVGGAVCDGTFPMNVPAWKEDPGHGLAGYHPGDAISFVVRRYDGTRLRSVSATFTRGDGTFESGNYTTVILRIGVRPLQIGEPGPARRHRAFRASP